MFDAFMMCEHCGAPAQKYYVWHVYSQILEMEDDDPDFVIEEGSYSARCHRHEETQVTPWTEISEDEYAVARLMFI